jgi:2-polyprenyl-6-methoxyphenol hydroxylase-like FAD-dependent oxidoreductase
MMDHSDVVIVGGGFVGLAAAAALADAGARVTILEALQGPNPAFRGELIHPRGVRALSSLHLLDPLLEAGGVRVRGFAVFAPRAIEPVTLPYPADPPSPEAPGLALDHRILVDTLRQALSGRPRISLERGARVTDVLCDGGRVVGVRVDGGRELRAAVVVAADGRHSRLRKLLAVPTLTELLSYSVALAFERDVLVAPAHGHVFVDAPGPTLAYPCGPGRVRMCIDVPLGMAKGQTQLRTVLRDHYAPQLPGAMKHALLEAIEHNDRLEGAANHAISTRACAVPGAALVGDAGGCSHPITATGMTTGLHDVMTLADCVAREGLTDDALCRYQRRRYRFVRAREAFTHALYDVLRGADPGSLALREGMFAYWSASARARSASIGVLCGDDERVATFALEYVRVVARSGSMVVGSGLADRDGRAALVRLGAMLAAAGGALNVALGTASSTLTLERTTRLPRLARLEQPAAG